MSEESSENSPKDSQEGDAAGNTEESSTATDASDSLTTGQNLVSADDQADSVSTVASPDEREGTAAPKRLRHPPVGRVRFNLNNENQTRMITSGNSSGFSCEEDGNHDGHVHIHIVRTDVFNISNYDVATLPTQKKRNASPRSTVMISITISGCYLIYVCVCPNNISPFAMFHSERSFGQWLTDNQHVEDHILFLVSLVFAGSMIMTLTFAWIEVDIALANISWLFATPVIFLIATQTCFWLLTAIYALWLYPKAYYRWKAEPTRPLLPHGGGRRRGRRRSHRRHRHRHSEEGSPSSPSGLHWRASSRNFDADHTV